MQVATGGLTGIGGGTRGRGEQDAPLPSQGHVGTIHCVACSPDGEGWRPAAPKAPCGVGGRPGQRHIFREAPSVRHVAWSPRRQMARSGSGIPGLPPRRRPPSSVGHCRKARNPASWRVADLRRDGKSLAGHTRRGSCMWDVATGKLERTLRGRASPRGSRRNTALASVSIARRALFSRRLWRLWTFRSRRGRAVRPRLDSQWCKSSRTRWNCGRHRVPGLALLDRR